MAGILSRHMGCMHTTSRPWILRFLYGASFALTLVYALLFAHRPLATPLLELPREPEVKPLAPLGPLAAPRVLPRRGGQGVDAKGRPQWLVLAPGLEFGEFRLNESDSKLTVLRIDPENFDFILCAAGEGGQKAATLKDWAAAKGLAAAINASMYLPDNRTSTGYMRSGTYVNNPRIMGRFGAFFVAGPRKAGIPRACIIDRDQPGWRERLDDYDLVIQNYRMTNGDRRILWSPGGPLYSISAVAEDGSGHILFLHSQKPVEAYSFVQQLLHLPLDARTVMYVEGGAQAGLLVNSGGLKRELAAPHAPSLLVTGNLAAILPNVLGILPRSERQ